jgi:hypothetical protein
VAAMKDFLFLALVVAVFATAWLALRGVERL